MRPLPRLGWALRFSSRLMLEAARPSRRAIARTVAPCRPIISISTRSRRLNCL
jgi:hypothetical protein